jgi:hypothetical protein
MQHQIDAAVGLFRTFMAAAHFNSSIDRNKELEKQMEEDHQFLKDHGFTETDIKLMCDLCV